MKRWIGMAVAVAIAISALLFYRHYTITHQPAYLVQARLGATLPASAHDLAVELEYPNSDTTAAGFWITAKISLEDAAAFAQSIRGRKMPAEWYAPMSPPHQRSFHWSPPDARSCSGFWVCYEPFGMLLWKDGVMHGSFIGFPPGVYEEIKRTGRTD